MLTMHQMTLIDSTQQQITTPLTIYENEIINKNKGFRLSKQDSELFTAYAKIEPSEKSSKKRRIDKQDETEDMSLNMLRARINTISRKHLLNIFSSGYETTNHSVNEGRINKEPTINSFASKIKSLAFLPDLNKNYLSYLYLVVKTCYLLSCVGQVFILNRLIGNDFHLLGFNLILSFLTDMEWPHLNVFPRISLCEIYIREIGTVHPYLIQCVLRINLFNELIFILVWFWLLFIITLTGFDLIARLFYTLIGCSNCQRKLFALKYLELIHLNSTSKLFIDDVKKIKRNVVQHVLIEEEEDYHQNELYDNNFDGATNKTKRVNRYVLVKANRDEEFDLFEKFCDNNFTSDTVFALRIIQQNASNLIVSEIIEYLWRQFKMLNFVYSNETNDFFLKRVIVQPTPPLLLSAHRQQSLDQNEPIKRTKKKRNLKE